MTAWPIPYPGQFFRMERSRLPIFRLGKPADERGDAGRGLDVADFHATFSLMSALDTENAIWTWQDIPWAEKRRAELRDFLEYADAELRDLIDAQTAFRKRYCVYTPQGLMYRAETLDQRESLSAEERQMQTDFQKLIRRRNALLSELASLTK